MFQTQITEKFFLPFHNMYVEFKKNIMTDQNSSTISMIRPNDLMAELNLKKSTYYDDLKFLDITASKDENKKAYLTIEQANQVRALRSHVNETGKRDGFVYGGLAVSNNSELADIPDNSELAAAEEENIYVELTEPTNDLDIGSLMRSAAELKARELAMPSLVKRELASQMTEDDLPEDLREKVAIAREVANPKFTPASVAQTLLSQYRSQRSS